MADSTKLNPCLSWLATAALVAATVCMPSVVRAEPDISIIYTVDTPFDGSPLLGGPFNCDAMVDDDCPLRRALELSNAYGGVATQKIRFQSDSLINLAAPLPVITHDFVDISAFDSTITRTVRIVGSGTSFLGSGNVFQIAANWVRIDGLRFYGAATGWANVYATSTAKNITISNNTIGALESAGPCPVATSYGGIYIDSTGPVNVSIGEARAWITGNTIRCPASGVGVEVFGTNRVYLGQDADGNKGATQRNTIFGMDTGVQLSKSANFNFVGNSTLANNAVGVRFTNDSYNNFATGNLIDSNQTGVLIDGGATYNLIGTNSLSTGADANVIRASTGSGVVISGTGTVGNSVHGNVIGRSGPGDAVSNGNSQYGVRITGGANGNFIGFTGTSLGSNVIGGNGVAGVAIDGGAHSNDVTGNDIGAGTGDTAIPNGFYGVLIGGNATTTNTIKLNLIGRNTLDGVMVNGARNNIIGDSNLITKNGRNGLVLQNGAQGNEIRDQSIFSNTLHGVLLTGATTTGNRLTQLGVFNNVGDGVAENSGAQFNTWARLSALDNGGLGIDKSAATNTGDVPTPPMPVITSVTRSGGNVTFAGIASTSLSPTSSNTVEVYRADFDSGGSVEGAYYLGSTSVDRATGTWTLTVAEPATACYTAFQTFTPGGGVPPESSESGPSTCRVMMPIMRN